MKWSLVNYETSLFHNLGFFNNNFRFSIKWYSRAQKVIKHKYEKYTCSMETVQQNGRFTLFSIKFPSNIYFILFGHVRCTEPGGMIIIYLCAQLAVLYTCNCSLILIFYRLGQNQLKINNYAVRSQYNKQICSTLSV